MEQGGRGAARPHQLDEEGVPQYGRQRPEQEQGGCNIAKDYARIVLSRFNL